MNINFEIMKKIKFRTFAAVIITCLVTVACVQDDDFTIPSSIGNEENENLTNLLSRIEAGEVQLITIDQLKAHGSATPTAGGAAYGTGTAYAFTAAGTSGQVLTSNGASPPTWQNFTASVSATDESTDTTCFPLFATDATGTVNLKTDASGLTYDSANERLQATDITLSFIGKWRPMVIALLCITLSCIG